jgi:hypothetical protein
MEQRGRTWACFSSTVSGYYTTGRNQCVVGEVNLYRGWMGSFSWFAGGVAFAISFNFWSHTTSTTCLISFQLSWGQGTLWCNTCILSLLAQPDSSTILEPYTFCYGNKQQQGHINKFMERILFLFPVKTTNDISITKWNESILTMLDAMSMSDHNKIAFQLNLIIHLIFYQTFGSW